MLVDDLEMAVLTGAILIPRVSLVAQMVKNLPAGQETQVKSLGWEDLLKKDMAPYSSILTWRILWSAASLVGYSPWGPREHN